MRPGATAAAFLPSSVVMSSISPVAILAIMIALPMASAGRFSPLGPLGIHQFPDHGFHLAAHQDLMTIVIFNYRSTIGSGTNMPNLFGVDVNDNLVIGVSELSQLHVPPA